MASSADRMSQLTNQLLAYARGGKYQVKIISLSDFVRNTLPLIEHALKPSINIETHLPPDILSVKADLTQLQMVVSSIVSNASEAIAGAGHIRISCRNVIMTEESVKGYPGLAPGRYVTLTIEDNGKGMDQETRSRIFEPFFTTKFQGRGLSMAAVYGIIKKHGGLISIDSELNQGTVVRIYLPAIDEKAEAPKESKKKPSQGTGTILVIEDEGMVMNIIQDFLKRSGYLVLEARTGMEAINIVENYHGNIDLAILDIVLPDMEGKTVYPLLMEARPGLKVIVCSGYSIDGPAQDILDAGAQGFIQKPFSPAALFEKIKEVFEGH
jgi:CheY-like chemotaxis protein